MMPALALLAAALLLSSATGRLGSSRSAIYTSRWTCKHSRSPRTATGLVAITRRNHSSSGGQRQRERERKRSRAQAGWACGVVGLVKYRIGPYYY